MPHSAWSRLLFPLLVTCLGLACGEQSRGPSDALGTGGNAACSSPADCGSAAECSAGKCVPIQTCTLDSECAAGEVCRASVCRSTCGSEAECAARGLTCDQGSGLCVPLPSDPDAAGGAGSGGANPSGGSDGTGGVTSTEPTLDLIDDLEDGDVKIAAASGRVGYWYSYNEDQGRPRMMASSVSEDGGSLAIHAVGTHLGGVTLDTAYGGLGVDLKNPDSNGQGPRSDEREPYDASAWDGVMFRIRGPGATKSVRFEVVTTAIATSDENGSCTGDGCFDAFGMDVPLSSTWTQIKVPFSSLVQEGWGQKKAFDASTVLGFAFEDLSTSPWDFWVDEIAFYKNAEVDGGDGGGVSGGSCQGSWGEESNGSVTWYTFSQGTVAIGDVNCSYGISQNPDKVNTVVTGAGTFFGAINTTDYETAAACGACVEVSRENGKKVLVTIVDQCPVSTNPKCVKGHIDLSKAAFLELGAESEGYLGQRAGRGSITWKYVPCPTEAEVSFRLKEPTNSNWNMVLVENHVYPIETVQVKVGSEWRNASRQEFNYWLPPGGVMGGSPYTVRATDVNGSVVEGTVTLSAGSQSSGEQFTCE